MAIRQERERHGWTQSFVAKKVGITQTMLLKLETGQRKPSYDVLVKLLDLFDYNDPRKLFGEATPDEKEPGGNRAKKVSTMTD